MCSKDIDCKELLAAKLQIWTPIFTWCKNMKANIKFYLESYAIDMLKSEKPYL